MDMKVIVIDSTPHPITVVGQPLGQIPLLASVALLADAAEALDK